jgi:sugar lactone lactonase YvrE
MKLRILYHLFVKAVALSVCMVPICARAAAGDLYVAGQGSGDLFHSVFKFTPTGMRSTFASFDISSIPAGIAFDTAGNLFVADTGTGTIFKFTPTGSQSTFASGLTSPYGLAFDGSGTLFVADGSSGAILRFTPSGVKSTFASGLGQAVGLAFDTLGHLFVTDVNTGTIFRFNASGIRSTFASGLSDPAGLAFDRTGNLFVADNMSGTIFKFTPAGGKTTFAAALGNVHGLAFDSSGNLFAAGQGTILKFAPDGTKTTFASLIGSYLAFEPVTEKLRNISARGVVQAGDNVLIAGLIVGGNALANNPVVLRAIGPSLSDSGIANPLLDPTLELHNSSGAIIASNDNWQDTHEAQIMASGLAPNDTHESAIVATLPAGAYTAVVRGANDTTGTALVEVYSLK